MRASDIMTKDPVVATEGMSMDEAVRLLYENDFRHLPVARGDVLVGILSDRDLRRFAVEQSDDPVKSLERAREVTVGQLMSTDPVRIDPEAEVLEMVEAILAHRIGAIPVTDPETGTLLGIVSYVDLLRLLE